MDSGGGIRYINSLETGRQAIDWELIWGERMSDPKIESKERSISAGLDDGEITEAKDQDMLYTSDASCQPSSIYEIPFG